MSFVDERIVKMSFDNADFSSKISSTIGSITQLNKATDEIASDSGGGLSLMGKAFEKTEALATQAGFKIQDVWLKVANIFEDQIANKIVNTAKKIGNALTMEGVSDGFKEYELKMGSIQTIMAGTGESLSTVNGYLEELNKYSDQTIYSFADMTNNIGKFTNAGVKLEDAVAAIKGIANEAAISGANANEASRAMYNFSQALSSGYVKLIDWKSIENANMATKSFKETLLEVATTCGTVEKDASGMYKILSTNAQGKVMDEMVSGTKNFNDSLQQQWMTTEVLTKALKIYATNVEDLKDYEKEAYESELKAMGFNSEQIKHFEELGTKATKAASEIKTFTMLMDTLKEAIGSGWAMTWQTIIGDFEQAKSLWTEVGNVVGGAIDKMSESRNNLLKESLQTGWEKFTSIEGAVIPAADKYRETLLEIGVASGKLTKEQADEIDSTEALVKSFHELEWVTGDTLITSVNKYWNMLSSMTEEQRKEQGITEKQMTELQNLNKQLKSGAINADDMAQSMNKLGGRENIIQGLSFAFHAFESILKTIGEAFREIFPPLTSGALYNATEKFKMSMVSFFNLFIKSTEDGRTRLDNLKRTAKGFFAIFKIAGRLISSFVNAIKPAGHTLLDLSDGLLGITANIGDWLVKLNDAIAENKLFDKAFEKVTDVVNKVSGAFQNFSTGSFKENISTIISKLKEFAENNKFLSTIGEIFKKLCDDISAGFEKVKDKLQFLKPLVDGLTSLFKGLITVIGYVFKRIGDTVSGLTGSNSGILGLTGLFNSLFSGGILYKIFSSVKSFSNIGELLENVGGAFEAFSKKIQAENLMNIAKAIALLAASLFVVALIDKEKLIGATTAISTMVAVMAGAMALLMKAINSFSTKDVKKTFSAFGKSIFSTDASSMLKMSVTLKAVSKALIAMGAAVLLMSVGLKIVASAAEGGHLWDSFAVISLMLAELTGAAVVLGKFGGNGKNGAKSLKSLTTALVIMSAALAIVAKVVEGGNAWDALKIISIMLGELGGIALLLEKFGKYKLGGLTGFISLTIALNIAVKAVKEINYALSVEGNHILEALGICTAMLAALAGAAVLLGKFGGSSIGGATGAIIAAAAILIVVQALKQINDLLSGTDNHVWQSLAVIAAGLLILAVGLRTMTSTMAGAAALLVASAALVVFSAALSKLGAMKLTEIGKGMLAIVGALAALAIGLNFMNTTLAGSAALLVAAAGLSILAGVLKVLGKMKLKEIVKAVVALGAALLVIGVVGSVLGVASPLLLAFGAAVAVLGVGLLAAGAGLTLFAAGLQTLLAVLPLGGTAITQLATTLVETFLNVLGLILTKFVEFGPQIAAAVLMLVYIILDVLVTAVPKIASAAFAIVMGILEVFTQNIPELARVGTEMIVAFIQAIGESIPLIVDEAFKCAIALINGLADAIDNNNEALMDAVDNLMGSVIDAIGQWLVKFTPLGLLMPEKLKEGVLSGDISLWEGFKEIISNTINKVKDKVSDFIQAGKNLIQGLIDGIKGKKKEAADVAAEVGNDTVEGLNSQKGLDEHSPSVKAYQSGKYLYQGLVEGMEDGERYVENSAIKLSESIKGVLEETSALAGDYMDIHPVISPVLDLSNVKEMGSLIGGLSPVASMNMASVVNGLHNTGIKQAELSGNQISELNFNSQKIEKAINDMSKEVRDTIMNTEIPLDVDVTVEADGDAIFRGVRKATAKFTKVNGYNPLVT